jgi:hypothetical protein
MLFVSTAIGVLGGLLALSSLLVARAPDAREKLEKLAQFQGWIGLTMFGWGVWELIDSVLGLSLLGSHPILWAFWLAMGVADFGVGMILGFGLISTYALRGNAQAIEKGARLRAALVRFQVPLGILAILTSLGYTALHFI